MTVLPQQPHNLQWDQLCKLPWTQPLCDWPTTVRTGMDCDYARHRLHRIQLQPGELVIKETETARAEYTALSTLYSRGVATVIPIGYVDARTSINGRRLSPALITTSASTHDSLSSLSASGLSALQAKRMICACAELIVHMHAHGAYWGDAALSNVLFSHSQEKTQEKISAVLVDAETVIFPAQLTDAARHHDLVLGHTHIAGELSNLRSGQLTEHNFDPLALAHHLTERYHKQWNNLQIHPIA